MSRAPYLQAVAALLLGLAWAGSAPAAPPKGSEWSLVFADDFDGRSLDGRKWTTCYWWADGGCTNLGNNEMQWYRPENVTVGNGNLRLTAVHGNVRGHRGRTFPFSSGMVTTGRYYAERRQPDRFAFTYGYVEVRARYPVGRGLWPAIWLLPSTHESKPEMDIMEVLGDTPDQLRLHYHYEAGGKERAVGHDVIVPGLWRDWNVYGLEWAPDALIWYLNDVEVWRFQERRTISREPMYLLINLAVGGDWPGAPDARTSFPAEFLIDYVRIWQRGAP